MNAKSSGVDWKREVLGFFVRNPETSDSAEGVARWRLLDQIVFRAIQENESILDEHVAHGNLEAINTPGVPRIYRLRRESAEKAAEYIPRRNLTIS